MAANNEGKSYYELGLDNSRLRADANRASNMLKGIGDSAEAEGARIDNAYKKIAGAVGGYFTITAAKSFIADLVRVRGEIESLSISFETLLGNKQKADALFSQIKTYAVNTPMQMNDLAKGAQMLLSFNVEAERVMPILKQIGDISMGDAQKFNSLTLAFSQMSSTGKLMGQDLLQMINAGFNPLSVISEKTGKSIGQLKKDMEGGAITSQMVADAFASATAEGGKFYGMLDKQSKGINGSISNLKGAIDDMLNSIGSANQKFITDAIQGASTAVKHYREIGEALATIVAIYGTYKAAVIATAAVNQSIATVRHTEEAAALYKLLSAEQQAKISKLGLATTSAEYAAVVKAEVAANVHAAQSALAKARTEVSAANQIVAARRAEYIAAKQLEKQRIAELRSILATGSAKQVEAAQRKLLAAETQRESAALSFQSATRDFHAKKIAVETAAKTANTAATAANTAAQKASVTATSILSAAKTRLAAVAARVNAAIMANPYALAAAAVIALAYGIYRLATYQTEAEKGQKRLNDAIKEAEKASLCETRELSRLKGELSAATKGSDEYNRIKDKIISNYGKYHKGLAGEIEKVGLLDSTYKKLTESIQASFAARQYDKFKQSESDNLDEVMSKNLGKIQDRLIDKLGDEAGSKYYAKIREAIFDGSVSIGTGFRAKGLDPETQAALDKISGRADKDFVQNYAIEGYIQKILAAQKLADELDKKARIKFGENQNANDGDKPASFDAATASLQKLMEQLPKAKEELEALKKAEKPDQAAIAAKEKEIQQIKAQTSAREKNLKAIKDVNAQIDALKNEQENYGKDDPEYKALDARIKLLKAKLPETEGQTNKAETEAARIKREAAERNRKIDEYGESVKKQVEQTELDIAQARIDATEEGYAREQAKNEFAYKRMIFANQQREAEMVKALQDARELEWENKNPKEKAKGETFDRSAVTAADLSPEQKSQIAEYYKVAEDIRGKANRDSLEKMLNDFMTYEQQRNRITEEYEKKRKSMHNEDGSLKSGVAQGNVDELNRSENEALKAVDEEFASREDAFQAWMNAISDMTLKQLEQTLEKAKKELGELEKSGGADSKQLASARAKVSAAKAKVSKARSENDVSPGKRSIKEWEDLYETLQEAEREFESIGDTVGGTAGEIIDAAGTILSSTLSMINSIVQLTTSSAAGMQASAVASAAAISTVEKASVILTIIAAAMQIAMAIVKLFNNDESYQKEIENLQGRIDQLKWELDNADTVRLQNNSFAALAKVREVYAAVTKEVLRLHSENDEYSNSLYRMFGSVIHQNEIMQKSAEALAKAYANIGYTADKALGKEKFSGAKEQLENLAEQQLLIQQQINSENSKKDTDNGQIEEWEKQIQELGQDANNIINEIVEGIIGGSAADIASELGDAFIDAFRDGEDAAEAWGEKVNDIVANVVKRMLVSKYLEEPLGQIFDKYKSKWYKDGEFAGIDAVMESMGGFANDLNAVGAGFQTIWENMPEAVKNMFSPSDDSHREASEKGVASASQDSVDELNGRMTAVQALVYSITEYMKLLIANNSQILQHLAGIESNTKSLTRLEKIETDIQSMKNLIGDIAIKGIKIKN
jgi:tape measure domain-containing protein